jgi:hypothetical protein
MEFLINFSVIAGGIVAFFSIVWGIIRLLLWIRGRHQPKEPTSNAEQVEEVVEYEYCTISAYKERIALSGYFYPITDDKHSWPHREPYDVTKTWRLTVKPNRRTRQHVEAVQRLMSRLQAEGWEFIGQPDPDIWYGYRFRRRKSSTRLL